MSIAVQTSPLPQGKTVRVTKEIAAIAGTKSWTLSTDADALLVSLYVTSVSGNLDVSVYTQIEEGKDLLVANFPTISAPTANLLLKKAAQIINQVKIVATWDDATEFEIYGRGVSAAESSVKILGNGVATASQTNILTSPTLVIPASITDRSGVVIKNNNGLGGAAIYFGFSIAEASLETGYPLSAQESIALDVASGVEIYAISTVGTTDLRILQGGG